MHIRQALEDIYTFNKRFMKEDMSRAERYEWLQKFVGYTVDELMEVYNELPFKHWKEYDEDLNNDQAILEEIADVLIFTFGMVDILGCDTDDIFREIIRKNEKNIRRQEEGY